LDLRGAGDGVDDAGELNQGAVAHELDHAAVVPGDRGVDQLPAMLFEGVQGACLVLCHEAAVGDHVGGEYGGEPSLHVR
jgi:hypothetical protein